MIKFPSWLVDGPTAIYISRDESMPAYPWLADGPTVIHISQDKSISAHLWLADGPMAIARRLRHEAYDEPVS